MTEFPKSITINDQLVPFEPNFTEDEMESAFRSILNRHVRPGRKSEFNAWLDGYMANKADEDIEDTLIDPDELYILNANVRGFVPLYGRDRIDLLVPEHVAFQAQDVGHSAIYFMEDYSVMFGKQRTKSRIHGNPLLQP